MAQQSSDSPPRDKAPIRGRHIPKRRFTRWALYYFVIYVCLPVLAVSIAVDALLYAVMTRFFDSCYAFFCLFR